MEENNFNTLDFMDEALASTQKFFITLGKFGLDAHQTQVDRWHRIFGQDGREDLLKKNNRDYLTRALSREGIFSALETYTKQHNNYEYMGVFIDIKDLRKVNNKHSQYIGDKYLHVASWVLRNSFQLSTDIDDKSKASIPVAMVARWGGDEFLALLPVNTSLDPSFMDLFSFSTEYTAGDGPKNLANFNIEDMLMHKDSHDLPISVDRSVNELLESGINDIKFAYNIETITLNLDDDLSGTCTQVIDSFMQDNGSKYVRKNAIDR